MELFYIFNVPSGHRFHVEMSPHWRVRQLQDCVLQLTGMPIDDQVLLKSNGEIMDSEEIVQSFLSENSSDAPVYLFQRSGRHDREDSRLWDQEINEITSIIDVAIENATFLEQDSDKHRVYLEIPQRARECRSAAQNAIHACARFAEEHRFIVQGWNALINNMDASIARLKKRATRFMDQIEKVRQQKSKAVVLLQDFDEVIDELKRIRLPGSLLAHSLGNSDRCSYSDISLYAWISASDPDHTLKELVEQVAEQFKNFEQADANATLENIEKVTEWSRNGNNREIRGINMRLSFLDLHLRKAEERAKTIEEVTLKILETPSRIDQSSLESLLSEYGYLMSQVYGELKQIRVICERFFKSKLELLVILRTRMNTWIARTYNRLHRAHNEVLMFEEKVTGLKQRLDLIRQIREAPVMYATAVAEVVRRKSFQKELSCWHALHAEKCSLLSEEESQMRAQFTSKIENHFLRLLFHGMFDSLPMFYVKTLSDFDKSLGPVDVEHLKDLRKNVEELKQYLNVAAPQVFLRLSIRDPSAPPSSAPSNPLRREESFFTTEPTCAMPTWSRNFPSSNWLSSDDVTDSSPSTAPALLMAKSPPSRIGSSSSLNMPFTPSLNQLSMLGEEDELPFTSASTSVAKTAPIQIPTPQPRQISEKSSQFSTPDDHFHAADPTEEQQFVVDDLTNRSQSFDSVKIMLAQIKSISKDMVNIRADVSMECGFFHESFAKLRELMEDNLNQEVKKIVEFYQNKVSEAEEAGKALCDALKASELEKEELKQKREEVEKLEKELEARTTSYKEGLIAMELERNRVQTEYEEMIEARDEKIRQLTKELEAKSAEVAMYQSDPNNEALRRSVSAEIRHELEKESKCKLDRLTDAIMQRKNEDIAKMRSEFENEKELSQRKYKLAAKWLAAERDRLRDYIISKIEDGSSVCTSVENEIKTAADAEEEQQYSVSYTSSSTQTGTHPHDTNEGMMMSRYDDMRESVFCSERVVFDTDDDAMLAPPTNSNSNNATTDSFAQTRIGARAMDRMVAVEDIVEGSTVLVIWNDRHNAYMLFSSSPYSHFVKESSVRRLGLTSTHSNVPRRNWILGRVSHLDLCVIRKADNRYRLPVETRVYRVDVEPLDLRSTRTPTV
ncbi:hypothetical protein Q1695_001110 [Nippostrongylus brasiliensis]|nr:hypothetical protein Q1695_001110 [Nippostrongylus brasiliensis]